MKKSFPRTLLFIICGVVAGVIISGVIYAFTGFSVFGRFHEDVRQPAETSNAELTEFAFSILGLIKDGDYSELSKTVHPEFGVVFSPCATVTLTTNKRFSAEQIAGFGSDSGIYIWGVRSSSGEPIEMTAADYFSRYVYDRDYCAASVIGVDHIVRSGNALENLTNVFGDLRFVDFHVPGGDGADGLSWSSLRLGFEEFEGMLWLSVVVHSEWTE